jgi:hypothetical protein
VKGESVRESRRSSSTRRGPQHTSHQIHSTLLLLLLLVVVVVEEVEEVVLLVAVSSTTLPLMSPLPVSGAELPRQQWAGINERRPQI